MNVARSTFVQRGYLLTALAVAVLLFASSGTAWAQTKISATSRFSGSSGTLPEGADLADLSEPRPLKVTITRSARSKNDPYNNPPSATGDQHSYFNLSTTAPGAFLLGSPLSRTIRLTRSP